MSAADSRPQVPQEAERSAVIGSPGPVCAACGGPRDPRKREACSDKCRAALSRRRKVDARRARDHEVRMLLETALRKLKEGLP
jgi:predicted nucleic acid-binding Zn ribbon protein